MKEYESFLYIVKTKILKLYGINLYKDLCVPDKYEIEKEVKEWFKVNVKWGNEYVRQTTKTIE